MCPRKAATLSEMSGLCNLRKCSWWLRCLQFSTIVAKLAFFTPLVFHLTNCTLQFRGSLKFNKTTVLKIIFLYLNLFIFYIILCIDSYNTCLTKLPSIWFDFTKLPRRSKDMVIVRYYFKDFGFSWVRGGKLLTSNFISPYVYLFIFHCVV